jgi:hypothetical protein
MVFGIDDAIAKGSEMITTIVNKVAPDANIEVQGKITQALTEMQNKYNVILGQLEINKVEAANPSKFIAGARPAAMWLSIATLFYSGIGLSIINGILNNIGLIPLQAVDSATQEELLYALLGVGSLRTYEKLKGIATTKIGK